MNILGIELRNKKLIYTELTKIYGIGLNRSRKICLELNIFKKRVINLTNEDISNLSIILKRFLLGINLKKKIISDINKLIYIKCYRGTRHKKKLPVRGQRTRTNSKSSRKISLNI